MKHPLRTLPLSLFFCSLFFMAPAGCGKKGSPLPPEGLVPEAVKSVRAKGSRDSLLLSWDIPQKNSDGSKLVDIAGFKLYKKISNEECKKCPSEKYPVYMDIDLEAPGAATIEGKKVTFVDLDLRQGKHYSYKVAPYNKNGYFGDFSKAVNIKWQSPPPPPQKLKGSASDRAATLSWAVLKDDSDSATQMENFLGYNIYRSQNQGIYSPSPVTKKPVTASEYTDIGLKNNEQYYYIVKSVINAGDTTIESEPSGEIILIPVDTMPPTSPKNLTAVLAQVGVRLFWETELDTDIMGYNIYRRKGTQLAAEKINEKPVEGTTFIDYDIENGKIYYYTITAIDNSFQKNESAPSKEESIKIPK